MGSVCFKGVNTTRIREFQHDSDEDKPIDIDDELPNKVVRDNNPRKQYENITENYTFVLDEEIPLTHMDRAKQILATKNFGRIEIPFTYNKHMKMKTKKIKKNTSHHKKYSSIEEIVKSHHYNLPNQPGLGVAVIFNNNVECMQGFGCADLIECTPITKDTVFDIAHLTQHMTCICILKLVKEGLLTLDSEVTKFIPEMEIFQKKITIKNLIFHTSGLPEYFTFQPETGWKSNEHVIQVLCGRSLNLLDFDPGTKYRFTNTNFVILACIIERLSKLSLREYMIRNLFDPLDMMCTTVIDIMTSPTVLNTQTKLRITNRCYGYTRVNGSSGNDCEFKEDEHDMNVNGDIGVLTTMKDFAKWDIAMRSKLRQLGIPQDLYQLIFQSERTSEGLYHGTAMGFIDLNVQPNYEIIGYENRETGKNPNCVTFEGSMIGTSCVYIYFIDIPLSIAVFSNISDNLDDVRSIAVACANYYILKYNLTDRNESTSTDKTSIESNHIQTERKEDFEYEFEEEIKI